MIWGNDNRNGEGIPKSQKAVQTRRSAPVKMERRRATNMAYRRNFEISLTVVWDEGQRDNSPKMKMASLAGEA